MKKVFKNTSIIEFIATISAINNSKAHKNVDRWYYDSEKQEGVTIQNI